MRRRPSACSAGPVGYTSAGCIAGCIALEARLGPARAGVHSLALAEQEGLVGSARSLSADQWGPDSVANSDCSALAVPAFAARPARCWVQASAGLAGSRADRTAGGSSAHPD